MMIVAVCFGRGMGVCGRISVNAVFHNHSFTSGCVRREFRFLSVGLRYHQVEVPLNPVIWPNGQIEAQPE
jgi:hypothetical protein